MMAEVWFYHLDTKPVEQELPGLLQRGLERNIRMAVVSGWAAGLADLSHQIWAHAETAFIAHALPDEPFSDQQAICLCAEDAPPNAAPFRFYVEGAAPVTLEGLSRASILFNGADESAVAAARELWKRFKAEEAVIRYWKQDEQGRWKDQAAV
jgi:DNA polymerase III subunit chi